MEQSTRGKYKCPLPLPQDVTISVTILLENKSSDSSLQPSAICRYICRCGVLKQGHRRGNRAGKAAEVEWQDETGLHQQ